MSLNKAALVESVMLPAHRLLKVGSSIAVFVVVVGGLVLAGWVWEVDSLTRLFLGMGAMRADTALGFILCGAALGCLSWTEATLPRQLLGFGLAGLTSLWAAGALLESARPTGLGLDRLFSVPLEHLAAISLAGRPPIASALSFLFLSAGLLLVHGSRSVVLAQGLAAGAIVVNLLAAIGSAYGLYVADDPALRRPPTVHSLVLFVSLGVGILAVRPERGLTALLLHESLGGVLARRLLPVALVAPFFLGWFSLLGQEAGWYRAPLGLAIAVLANIVVFAGLVIWMSSVVNRMVERRAARETALRERAVRELAERTRAEDEVRHLNEELEERVRQRTAELEAANKELEAFSYSVSHDLRAPLRAIDGFSRILLQKYAAALPEDAQRYFHDVRAASQQMGRLIDDLLTFARLSRQPLNKQRFNPRLLVQECLEDLHAEQQSRQVAIRVNELTECDADPALLKQAWINLLSNALKYTRHRQEAVITIGSQPGDKPGEQIYFVQDNGVGFDMRYAHKLFGVFQRLHRADEYEGTGVGLAIVQRIVHRHGGRVWVHAEPDRGATFCFTLHE